MNWADGHKRMALLRLHHEGTLRSGAKTWPVIEHLLSLGWVGQTTRRDVVAAVPFARDDIRSLLDTVWPEWRRSLTDLLSHGLPLTVENLSRLDRRATLTDAKSLPTRLHRKTLAAVLGLHSKASLPTDDELGETGVEATTDNVLRLRPNRGLRLRFTRAEIDCDSLMAAAGEVILPERAFSGDVALSGVLPAAILTVENLGAYVDLPEVPGLLVAHTPGWDSPLTVRFLTRVPLEVPLHHFGDLDQAGMNILRHLQNHVRPDYRWFLPSFWQDYVGSHGLVSADGLMAPAGGDSGLKQAVEVLNSAQRWLEQEAMCLDQRLCEDLQRVGGRIGI